MEAIDAAVEALRRRTRVKPRVGLILGSGLGSLAGEVQGGETVPTAEIPGWPISTVEGHAGRIVFGTLEGQPVLIQQGRAHYYEGHSMPRLGLPVRVMQRLGIEILIVTNAAGAIDPSYHPGDLMLLRDHINLMGMAGLSPLRGPNLDALGPRFPDMSQAYDPDLRALARSAAAAEGVTLHEGVYVCLGGPTFESPADLRFLRGIGADAVGMSTVPEVIAAVHAGLKVFGLSCITDLCLPDALQPVNIEEILETARKAEPKITLLVQKLIERWN